MYMTSMYILYMKLESQYDKMYDYVFHVSLCLFLQHCILMNQRNYAIFQNASATTMPAAVSLIQTLDSVDVWSVNTTPLAPSVTSVWMVSLETSPSQ